eukprot:GILK01005976.1.p1 GENE.GILK01005976.1~~GILK01005976.1.p1  ORF type:complete len:934 (+),score=188.90 GILK01005976.1:182-2983(+)
MAAVAGSWMNTTLMHSPALARRNSSSNANSKSIKFRSHGRRSVGDFDAAVVSSSERRLSTSQQILLARDRRHSELAAAAAAQTNNIPRNEEKENKIIAANSTKNILLKRKKALGDLQFAVALLTLVLMVVENEIRWESRADYAATNTIWQTVTAIRTLNSLVTLFLLYLLLRYYQVVKNIMVLQFALPPFASIFHPRIFFPLCIEILVCLIHVPPAIDYYASSHLYLLDLTTTLSAFMFLRIYLLLRLLEAHSPINSSTGRFIGSITNVPTTPSFLFKTWLEAHPVGSLLVGLSILVFVCSYVLHLYERNVTDFTEFPQMAGVHARYSNSLWMLIITVLTIGYGDVFPITPVGRLVAILAACSGLLISATMIGVVHNSLELNRGETKVVQFIRRHKYHKAFKFMAASLIQRKWRYCRLATELMEKVPQVRRVNHVELVRKPSGSSNQHDSIIKIHPQSLNHESETTTNASSFSTIVPSSSSNRSVRKPSLKVHDVSMVPGEIPKVVISAEPFQTLEQAAAAAVRQVTRDSTDSRMTVDATPNGQEVVSPVFSETFKDTAKPVKSTSATAQHITVKHLKSPVVRSRPSSRRVRPRTESARISLMLRLQYARLNPIDRFRLSSRERLFFERLDQWRSLRRQGPGSTDEDVNVLDTIFVQTEAMTEMLAEMYDELVTHKDEDHVVERDPSAWGDTEGVEMEQTIDSQRDMHNTAGTAVLHSRSLGRMPTFRNQLRVEVKPLNFDESRRLSVGSVSTLSPTPKPYAQFPYTNDRDSLHNDTWAEPGSDLLLQRPPIRDDSNSKLLSVETVAKKRMHESKTLEMEAEELLAAHDDNGSHNGPNSPLGSEYKSTDLSVVIASIHGLLQSHIQHTEERMQRLETVLQQQSAVADHQLNRVGTDSSSLQKLTNNMESLHSLVLHHTQNTEMRLAKIEQRLS